MNDDEQEAPAVTPSKQATQLSLAPEVVALANEGLKAVNQVQGTKLKIAELKTRGTKKILEVSQADAKDERDFEARRHLRTLIFTGVVIVLVLGFGIYGIERGLKDLIGDLIKLVVGAALGGFGGWGLRGHQEKRNRIRVVVPTDDDEDDDE